MNEYDPAIPHETSDSSTSASMAEPAHRPRARRLPPNRRRWIAAAALSGALVLAGCGATSSSGTTASSSATAGPQSGGGSNARSGPATGGSSGTVTSVSTSGFTLTTSAGQKVTVTEASSTTYANGTSSASESAVVKGVTVLVLGTTNGTTITATQVTVQPTDVVSTTYTASAVVPFQRGAPSKANADGQIPKNYTEGSGTIVSGTTANKATEAALAAYPGGVVDRVVKLSNGEYEAHYIGVNWPHHIFVSHDFKVVGAN